jgi:hypothetical protein
VIAGHDRGVAAAEHAREIARRAAPGRGGLPRGDGESAVEVGDEGRQEGIGGLAGGDAAQAQFADQAILQRLPEAFDAALGLGALGGDVPDAEVLQHAA